MTHHADLELSLSRRETDSYVLHLRFTLPDSDAETRLLHETPLVRFDDEQLRAYSLDDVRYGTLLGAALFADPHWAGRFPPLLSPDQAAELLQVPKGTIYDWSSRGLLDGCKARVGKHLRLARDRLLQRIFNGGLHHEAR